jgi:hypothetical protein
VRTSLARKERQMMEGLPDRVDLPDDPNGLAKAEAEFEKQAAGVTAERFSQEYTDGLIVSFDGKGGIKGLVWTEVKTDQRGITNGLAQFDRNTEDIDQIVALNTDAVVKVEKGGQVLFLSLEDAAKASGGSVVDEMLVLAEKADVVARLEALEKKQSSFDRLTPADVADLNKIRAELLFRSFKAMARELYVGAEQKAKLAAEEIGNVRIRDYGHDYVTVVDVVATLLATMGFKNL